MWGCVGVGGGVGGGSQRTVLSRNKLICCELLASMLQRHACCDARVEVGGHMNKFATS